jgi:putative ABC transport system substrate-binding protein
MKRRAFLTGLAVLAAPCIAGAQQVGRTYRVGLILTTSPVAVMMGPNPAHSLTRFLAEHGPNDYTAAFSVISREHADALITSNFPHHFACRRLIAEFALKNRLPSMSRYREFVEVGGLMSYAADGRENYRRAAIYVDKILKGAKPGDLPVEQPTKFELVINLKTAKALGLTIPQSLLLRADEVIQ